MRLLAFFQNITTTKCKHMSKSNTTTNSSNEQIQGLQTRNIPLKELHPNNGQLQEMGLPTNPRLIRDTKFKLLVQSIQDDPEMLALRELLVFDSGNEKTGLVIVGGNMRYRAMKKLGYEDAPCKVLPPDFPIDKLRRIVLKDNSSYGEIDFDLLLAGFDDDEILKAAIEVPDINTNTEEEEAQDDGFDIEAATPKKAKSKIGDIYRLGNHLLICGDSTDPRYIDALMDGQQADLLVTDPPYNVNYQAKGKMKIENDNMDDANFLAFLTDVFTIANDNLKQGGAFYIWHADGKPGLAFRQAAKNVGWEIKQLLVWNKNSFTLGRQDYQWKHEPCLYGWKEGAAHYFRDIRSLSTVLQKPQDIAKMTKAEMQDLLEKIFLKQELPTTVIDCEKPLRNEDHPTMKPVPLIGHLVNNSSRRGDIVLDIFGGSGTTLVVCEQMGRKCRMVEFEPIYVDVIIKRWEELTGMKAFLQRNILETDNQNEEKEVEP